MPKIASSTKAQTTSLNPKQPLPFAALASQKNYVSLYLMGLYTGCTGDDEGEEVAWFRQAWEASGKKKLDMGKSCVKFKKLDDIALDVIGEAWESTDSGEVVMVSHQMPIVMVARSVKHMKLYHDPRKRRCNRPPPPPPPRRACIQVLTTAPPPRRA